MKDGYSNRSVEDERRGKVMRLMEQVLKYIVYPWRRWLRYRYEQGNMRPPTSADDNAGIDAGNRLRKW